MKKYLSILGLAIALSQPVFAQCCPTNTCNSCLPRAQVITAPMVQSCAPACQAPVYTGAACPVNTCNTGYACPINNCNTCCPDKKGFFARFFGY